jgi:hypothetical protein
MANDRLIEEFDECVTRLADGVTIEDCVRLYPRHQNELRVMLHATKIPQQAQVSFDDVRYSQARVRVQFEKALIQATTPRRAYPLQRIASIFFLLIFVGSILTTGVVVVAQDSIPGDSLYGVKRFSEQVRLSVASDKEAVKEGFNQRRIEETKQVIKLRREVDVRFTGLIEVVSESAIHVSGLIVEVSEPLQTISFMRGMRVDVLAKTRLDQTLLATDIHILELSEPHLQLDETFPITPTVATATETVTIRPDFTATPSETQIIRKPSAMPTQTSPQETPTLRPSSTPTETHHDVTATESGRVITDCEVPPPSDWIRYTIQSGDSPLGIAIGTDISLDQLFDVNCDLNSRLILVGDVIFVPYEPRLLVTATALQRPTATQVVDTITDTQRPADNTDIARPTATSDRTDDKSSDQRKRDKEDVKDRSDSR